MEIKSIERNCNAKEFKMEMTPEIEALIAEKVAEALAAKADDNDDIEQAIDEAAEKKVEALEKRLADREYELEVNSYVKALHSKTGQNEKILRKIFEPLKTEEARKVKFDHLMEASDSSVISSIEQQYMKPSVEKALAMEFESKGGVEYFGISKDEYVHNAMNSGRINDLK
jgi:phosphoribosyl-ATP pyrophosphohydrolase